MQNSPNRFWLAVAHLAVALICTAVVGGAVTFLTWQFPWLLPWWPIRS